MSSDIKEIIEINVGGVVYSTKLSTLRKEPNSVLSKIGEEDSNTCKDSNGRYFLDRDGVLFRFILDFLRNDRLVLPESFQEKERLLAEAESLKLSKMFYSLDLQKKKPVGQLPALVSSQPKTDQNDKEAHTAGHITVGYRGTFAFGRDGVSDVNFRKISRILVCGKVCLCKEVFGDSLNESRDPDRGESNRYTSRYFLKHTFLEQAFDKLAKAGFRMVGSTGSGTANTGDLKPGSDLEENKWNHYNEFVFYRC